MTLHLNLEVFGTVNMGAGVQKLIRVIDGMMSELKVINYITTEKAIAIDILVSSIVL